MKMNETLFHIGQYKVLLGGALGAVSLVVLAFVFMAVLRSGMDRRARRDPQQRSRLYSARLLVKYILWVVVLVGCMAMLRIDVTFLLAGSAAVLVALSLGIQQTFNDVFSGIILLVEGTIRVGDVLELGPLVGRVKDIHLRTSTIYSHEGMNVIVPNRRFINENVVNWSHNALETRFSLSLGVAYGSNEEQVSNLLLASANVHPQVITDDDAHPVSVRLINFGASTLDFEILFWSRNAFNIEQTKSEIRFTVLKHLRNAGIAALAPRPIAAMAPLTEQVS